MDIQACLPPTLAALHNFIWKHDPKDLADYESVEDPQPGTHAEGPAAEGSLAEGILRTMERWLANQRQAAIRMNFCNVAFNISQLYCIMTINYHYLHDIYR